jgi:hypothetical protein
VVLPWSVGAFYSAGREVEVAGIGGAAAVNGILNGAVTGVKEEGGGRLKPIKDGAELLRGAMTVGVSPWCGRTATRWPYRGSVRGHGLVGRLRGQMASGLGKETKIEINFKFDFQF